MNFFYLILVAIVFTSFISGCSHCFFCGAPRPYITYTDKSKENDTVINSTVAGTVSCMERITILPDFELTLCLQEMNKKEKGAVVAEQNISNFQSLPVRFNLEFSISNSVDNVSYGLSAELKSQGVSLFATDTLYPVQPLAPAQRVDIVLVRVRE